jgi:predicted dehydrogenase
VSESISKPVGVGLLGAGWMGDLHTDAYKRVTEHYRDLGVQPRLVMVADQDANRARAAQERHGYELMTTDWRELIEHPEIDAVSITAPNFMHREMAVAAAEAGKHFWGEKPLGRNPDETAQIAAAVDAAGICTTVGFNYRHAPMVQHARNLIARGELGEITRYSGVFLCDYASHPLGALSWRFSRELAGLGVLGDLMSHAVDMAHYLIGPVARVSAQQATLITERPKPSGASSHFSIIEGGEMAPVENEDSASSLVQFASGVRGTLEASRVVVGPHARMHFEVHGTSGALAWNFERLNELQLFRVADDDRDAGYATVMAGPQHPDFAHFMPGAGNSMGFADMKVIEGKRFLESIRDGRPQSPSAADALASARVIDAMLRSIQRESWTDVQPITAAQPAAA